MAGQIGLGQPGLNRRKLPKRANTSPSTEGGICLKQARTHWLALQGIGCLIDCDVAEAVRRTGWIYSPGSTGPYLALRARLPECGRAAVERAVFTEEILVEVFALRGCAMLVPAEDVPLALWCASRFLLPHFKKVSAVCTITETEVRDLTSAITTILRDGAQTPETLRETLPKCLVRNLGEAGRKVGENSTASFVLRKLQVDGIVQRIAADRRLDSGHYAYRLSPHKARIDLSPEKICMELARRFFRWAAPATLKEFAWWAGINQKEARVAVEESGLENIPIAGWAAEAWLPPDQIDSLKEDRPRPRKGRFHLLPFRDNYLYFRRGIGAFLDIAERGTSALDWNNRLTSLGDLESLHHNAILLQDCLVGAWEFDPEADCIVWRVWSAPAPALWKSLARRTEELEQFIRRELGDAAFYPFDTGSKRRERIDFLRLR